jgi:hypothetical protein
MLGFHSFDSARMAIAGIELLHRIRQEHFDLKHLGLKEKTVLEILNAALTALGIGTFIRVRSEVCAAARVQENQWHRKPRVDLTTYSAPSISSAS